MPIQLKQKLMPVSKVVRLESGFQNDNRYWMAWWYSGIYKNRQAMSQPNVLVGFREVLAGGSQLSDNVTLQRIPLTALGQVRLGSVWQNGVCKSERDFLTREFIVDFTEGEWSLTSFGDAEKKESEQPFPLEIYPWNYPKDKNWFIQFNLPSGGKLVIPCLEFFARCYGRSAELRRVLATYPWRECEEKRLYAPLDEPEEPGKWKVKLRRRLVDGDITLLAHAKYDPYTERAVRSIYSQIEVLHDPQNRYPAFIKVRPWFQGVARLKVKGIWFGGGRSFLALQVIGGSEPGGVPILGDRENTNLVDKPADPDSPLFGKAWAGVPERRCVQQPEIVDLTGSDEPDSDITPIEIEYPEFEVLGEPRVIIKARKEQAAGSSGPRAKGKDATAFSSGECYGHGQGIGYAAAHARAEMESQGVLRDMWNAMLFIRKKYPKIIQSVEWFTFDDRYSSEPEPKLIALKAFDLKDKVSPSVRNWVYINNLKEIRGVLMARLMVRGDYIYILEIQRKLRLSNGNMDREESFTGLVFTIDDNQHFEAWLHVVLSNIRYAEGSFKKLIGKCPGSEAVFKHSSSGTDEVPSEAALLNALSKMDVHL